MSLSRRIAERIRTECVGEQRYEGSVYVVLEPQKTIEEVLSEELPQWRDRPTEPGLWVFHSSHGPYYVWQLDDEQVKKVGTGAFYGPIPENGEKR